MNEKEPDTIVCYFCSTPGMEKKHRVETSKVVRILWCCSKCGHEYWKDYGEKESARERKTRWH
jgi:RNase P subunit RPR2